jgi:hypothetical protein
MHVRGEESVKGFDGKAKEGNHLEDHGVDGRMESEGIVGRLAGGVYSGSSWLRTGTGGGLL